MNDDDRMVSSEVSNRSSSQERLQIELKPFVKQDAAKFEFRDESSIRISEKVELCESEEVKQKDSVKLYPSDGLTYGQVSRQDLMLSLQTKVNFNKAKRIIFLAA